MKATDLFPTATGVPTGMPVFATSVWTVGIFTLFVATAVPIGLTGGILIWTPSAEGWLRTAALAFFLPAIVEETVFRGPLLFLRERAVLAAVLSTVLFMAWHPVAALLFRPAVIPIFTDPMFLLITGLFGITASAITLITRRLVPAVMCHWCVVVAWKQVLGGPDLIG